METGELFPFTSHPKLFEFLIMHIHYLYNKNKPMKAMNKKLNGVEWVVGP